MVRFFVAGLMALMMVPNFGYAQGVTADPTMDSTTIGGDQSTTVAGEEASLRGSAGVIDRYENETKTDDIGVGVVAGAPFMVGGKYWLNEVSGIDASVGFNDDGIALITDYLYHFRGAFADRGGFLTQVTPYVGGGLVATFDEDGTDGLLNRDRESVDDSQFALGARIPVGVEYMPRAIPAGFFAEVAPGLGFVPDAFAFLQAGVGARFYF